MLTRASDVLGVPSAPDVVDSVIFVVPHIGESMPVPDRPARGPRRLLRDLTFDSVLGAITDGTLRPGERLLEDDVATWLGVSKTPVKEALARLATQGLVHIQANRFTRVAAVSHADLLDTLELLGLLHGEAVRSAETAPVAEASVLADALRAAVTAPAPSCHDLLDATAPFVELSANPLTRKASEPLENRAAFLLRHLDVALPVADLHDVVTEADEALRDRRWVDAGRAVTTLLARDSLAPVRATPAT